MSKKKQASVSVNWKETLTAYLFLSPFLLVFFTFLAYPVFYSLWLSLHKTTIYSNWYDVFGDMKYVGLGNYAFLLSNLEFWWSLFLTLGYGLLTIPTGIALALFLALLLNNRLRGHTLFRSAFFLPNVLDLFVIGLIWVFIFSPKYGLLDMALQSMGLAMLEDGLLGNPWTCLPAIALAMVLKGAGFGMVLFLTAMQNIPQSVYEAAQIDGATPWQTLRYITIPLLKPIILFMVITGTIAGLTAFTEIYAMTVNTGGPTIKVGNAALPAASLSGYYLYRNFADDLYGRAAAISFLLLVVALVISLINMKLLKSDH